jgi:hypothetical protein
MTRARTEVQRKTFRKRILASLLLASLTGMASVAGATYSVPADRSVTWQGNVGVKGDIPYRSTIYKTLSPSGGDDSSAIQTAINNCPSGSVVQLGAGTFKLATAITMKAGITVRGAGMGKTVLQGQSGMTGNYMVGFKGANASYNLSNSPSINVIGGLGKGSTTISTAAPHGWAVGDYVAIDQLNNASADPPVSTVGTNGSACTWCGRANGTRALGQMVKIVAVPSATSATVEIPLYWNFNASLTPQGTKVQGIVADAGIEDLSIDNTVSANSGQSDDGTVYMNDTVGSWLLRVEIIGSYKNMIRLYGGYRDTIRGCRFHEGTPALPVNGPQYDTSRAYGINLCQWASAILIENNEFYHLAMSIVNDGPVSGNVISYNYFHDNYNSVSWQQDAIANHGAHPMMNLYEGNLAVGLTMGGDNIWGTSSNNTMFRNRITNSHTFTSRTWAIDLYQHVLYYNMVGNVIGDSTDTIRVLDYMDFNISNTHTIFKTGYVSGGDSTAAGNDSRVLATLLTHGNWDSVSNTVNWNGNDDRTLPSSLYLTAKPAWWGTMQWPAIGPDVSPMYPAAPVTGSGTPWGSSNAKVAPAPPTALKAQ